MPDTPIWIEGTTDADRGKRNKHREDENDFKSIEHVVQCRISDSILSPTVVTMR